MKRFMVSLLTFLFVFTILGGTGAAFFLYGKYSPSKEFADQAAWYGVSGDEVAIIWNQEPAEAGTKGRVVDGEVYLPLSWVAEQVNEKFYWDAKGHQLIYTLPESIIYAGTDTLGSSGKPLILEEDEEVWLLAGLVQTYTNVRLESFLDTDVKRIYVDNTWEPELVSAAKKDSAVRVRGGVKSQILTEVLAGNEVTVLETLENWSKVRTKDGFVGYMENRRLGETKQRMLISTFAEPEYTNISLEEPICMVWHQVTTQAANKSMKELMEKTKGVHVIAPTWFMLTDNQGNYESLASQEYVDAAHEMGLQVWGVLDNFNKGANVQSEILFADTEARKNLIAQLMKDVKTYDLDGINLDIESIKAEAGPHYVQFIRELSVDCRKAGIILSVDTYVPSPYTAFYNREEIGRVADYVVIMGYDEHYAGGEAGSVASYDYVEKGISDTLSMVPRGKVLNGIPFYTRLWNITEGSSKAMGISAAKKWVSENQVELVWQEELGQYYGEITLDGMFYQLWMEEDRSVAKKMELIRQKKLAGVACWKLGFEDEGIWNVVNP